MFAFLQPSSTRQSGTSRSSKFATLNQSLGSVLTSLSLCASRQEDATADASTAASSHAATLCQNHTMTDTDRVYLESYRYYGDARILSSYSKAGDPSFEGRLMKIRDGTALRDIDWGCGGKQAEQEAARSILKFIDQSLAEDSRVWSEISTDGIQSLVSQGTDAEGRSVQLVDWTELHRPFNARLSAKGDTMNQNEPSSRDTTTDSTPALSREKPTSPSSA
ncbi:hypothetical protein I317_07381 [Kwoniella heveanensis CBS 569]|nr:hypothetical protein I317_07381 [Kwoniella heveanensis CBS 569]